MVSALEGAVRREDWDLYESRIERNTYRLLDILDRSGSPSAESRAESDAPCVAPRASRLMPHAPPKATFFCLGWVAERYPHLIREIHARGHEIASHGYDHRMITTMTPDAFREDVRTSKGILEDLAGKRVLGYRAPSYSITRESLWALGILAEEGYQYDSSIFPVHHDLYGIPDAPRFPFILSVNGSDSYEVTPLFDMAVTGKPSGNLQPATRSLQHSTFPSFHSSASASRRLIEFPPSTLRLLGQNIPVAGGGYFRLFPQAFTGWAARRIAGEEGHLFAFYLHPWEIDPEQPRVEGISLKSRFRHYLNLDKTESRLEGLIKALSFTSFRELLRDASLEELQVEYSRRWPRVEVRWTASIRIPSPGNPGCVVEGNAIVENISCGGAFLAQIRLEEDGELYESGVMEMKVASSGSEGWSLRCTVVRVHRDGAMAVGVQFVGLTEEGLDRIRSLLQ